MHSARALWLLSPSVQPRGAAGSIEQGLQVEVRVKQVSHSHERELVKPCSEADVIQTVSISRLLDTTI